MSISLRLRLIAASLILVPVFALGVRAQETATVMGVITSTETGETLPGASAALRKVSSDTVYTGASANSDGRYEIPNLSPGRYLLTASFIGYDDMDVTFALSAGETLTFNLALETSVVEGQEILVTGIRPAKITDTPSAAAYVSSREIEQEVVPSPTDVLRKVPGVDMGRTGIDRREIVLRGFGKTFTGATYVMTDYRQSAVASLGVNAYNMMPISSIDLDHIEVVRGPAGALYGPGVDEGAIHFISKDPFEYPGTTIALSGGEQSFVQGQLRHAGVISKRFGYKINAQYLQAREWKLDPADSLDLALIDNYYTEIPLDRDVHKVIVNGTAAYKIGDATRLTATAGFASTKSPFLSDIGPLQSDGFGYRFGQLRLTSGRFFAQAYLNANDAGDSFIYAGPQVPPSLGGETVVDNSTQLNLQAQYGLDFVSGREQVTFGADFERTNPATKSTINGRNEDHDEILEYGVYAQSNSRLSQELSLVLAGRLDYDNIFEKLQFSPRAGIVYKPAENHSLRATYNRSFASPGTNSLFLDIIAAEAPFPVRARGAKDGYTFRRNPAFGSFAASDLIATSFNPTMFGEAMPVGLPIPPIYGLIYGGLSSTPIPELQQDLCTEHGFCLTEDQVAFLVAELSPDQTPVEGFSDGGLALRTDSEGHPVLISDAVDVAPLKQPSTQTFEIGYRGPVAKDVYVSLDAYYSIKDNFLRGLQLESPLVYMTELRPDLATAITDGIVSNTELEDALDQLGIPPEVVADLLVDMADRRLPPPNLPIAVVQPAENSTGVGQPPELLMTYRNFGRVAFFGLEAAANVILNKGTTLYGSLSWVSDDYFDHEELDEENEDLYVSLNAPTLKAAAGGTYTARSGLTVLLGGRYVEGFMFDSGPYRGEVDDYFLLDVGAGYDFGRFAPGLRLDVTVQNALDHMHRELIGAPKMGRLGLARLTYSFQ